MVRVSYSNSRAEHCFVYVPTGPVMVNLVHQIMETFPMIPLTNWTCLRIKELEYIVSLLREQH